MTARFLCAAFFPVALFLGNSSCRADDPSLRADQLIAALQEQRFDDAARMFHYPQTYTPAELSSDRAGIVAFLSKLMKEVGGLKTTVRIPPPEGRFLTLGASGGSVQFWSSHPELNGVQNITYKAQVNRDGEVYFVVTLIHPMNVWEVRTLAIEIPASRPGAAERMHDLTRKTSPPLKAGETA